MGTPDFAVASLEAIAKEHDVVGVFTQPDSRKGRGKKLSPSPVKVCAQKLNIDVYQPERLSRDGGYEILQELNPDCIVVVAYGQLLKQNVLSLPKYGCINVHGSLLPKYRGAAPIHWALVNGEKVTGITTMNMVVELDAGAMLLKEDVEITDTMTTGELHDILKDVGASLIVKTLDGVEDGSIIPEEQEHEKHTYAPKISRETGYIDFTQSMKTIDCLIRGMNPFPVASAKYGEGRVKIFEAVCLPGDYEGKCGEILSYDKTGMIVKCGDGAMKVTIAQFGQSKRMHISQYILGHDITVGAILTKE